MTTETLNHPMTQLLALAPKSSEADVLRLLIELGCQYVRGEEGSLLVLDPDTRELVFAMTVGSRSSEKELVGQRVPLGQGITGLAAATEEVQIGAPTFSDIKQSGRDRSDQPSAVLAAPMLAGDELVGVITTVSFDPKRRFNGDDAVLYGRIAAVAGVVVHQAQQLDALRRLHDGGHANSPQAKRELELVDAVTALSRGPAERQAKVLSLLRAVAALAEE